MRNSMAGFAVFGLLAVGTGTSVSAHPLSVPRSAETAASVRQVEWDDCGRRCQEHRREAREREREHQHWVEHRRWEEHHGWDESHGYPPAPAPMYQHRY